MGGHVMVQEDVLGTVRGRVPVEHRWFGMDRRTAPFAWVVIAVFLVATVVVPRIDRAISWDDPARAGEQLQLAEGLTFAPATGWNVERGFRTGGSAAVSSGPALLNDDGVSFSVQPGTFSGNPTELLAQIDKVTSATGADETFKVSGDTTTISTDAGDVGVLQTYSSVLGDGIIAAFVIDGTGLQVTAYGPPDQMTAANDEIRAMIASITSSKGEAA